MEITRSNFFKRKQLATRAMQRYIQPALKLQHKADSTTVLNLSSFTARHPFTHNVELSDQRLHR